MCHIHARRRHDVELRIPPMHVCCRHLLGVHPDRQHLRLSLLPMRRMHAVRMHGIVHKPPLAVLCTITTACISRRDPLHHSKRCHRLVVCRMHGKLPHALHGPVLGHLCGFRLPSQPMLRMRHVREMLRLCPLRHLQGESDAPTMERSVRWCERHARRSRRGGRVVLRAELLSPGALTAGRGGGVVDRLRLLQHLFHFAAVRWEWLGSLRHLRRECCRRTCEKCRAAAEYRREVLEGSGGAMGGAPPCPWRVQEPGKPALAP